MKNLLLLLTTLSFVNSIYAQRDPSNVWNWPEDRATAVKGGEIKTFGTGDLRAPVFEKAAYSISEEGEILKPIESTDFKNASLKSSTRQATSPVDDISTPRIGSDPFNLVKEN